MLADSSAVFSETRILPQHQTAITIINTRLQIPNLTKLCWLDLACGKGQILSQLSDNISTQNRNKIFFVGYDINIEHIRKAEQTAHDLGFASYSFLVGDISSFSRIVSNEDAYDFITCTNTVHELNPKIWSKLIIDSLIKLSDSGELFIYDMESLDTPELGALPWSGSDIDQMLNSTFEVLGIDYRVDTSTWRHTKCNGWTLIIQREYINVSKEEIIKKREELYERITYEIDVLLDKKLFNCEKVLNEFQRGIRVANDKKEIEAYLYEYWALRNCINHI